MAYYRLTCGRVCAGFEIDENGFVVDGTRSARWLVGRTLSWVNQWGAYQHWKIARVVYPITEKP
jgi:hypothetical protein